MHPLTLIFGILLLSKANALNCYRCLPTGSGPCTVQEKACPSSRYQCGALRISSYAGNSKLADIHMQTCLLPDQCVSGSINYGISRNVITSKCCSTALCNTKHAPAPLLTSPNGRRCYHCDSVGCRATLHCVNDEDLCITKTVNSGGQKKTMKGCASTDMCSDTQSAQVKGTIGGEILCCQGDFCNSASSTSSSLLLLVVPLVSLVMFS